MNRLLDYEPLEVLLVEPVLVPLVCVPPVPESDFVF
jgi:hypothetical protein